jgi:hypothetical protein
LFVAGWTKEVQLLSLLLEVSKEMDRKGTE